MSTYFMDAPTEGDRLSEKVDPIAWVRDYVQPLGSFSHVLDVGCGPGVIAAALAQFAADRVAGIDLSAARVAQAQTMHAGLTNLTFAVGQATALPYPDETFDLVIARMLLQYLPDRSAAIQEFRRVLKPGGRLLLQDLDGQLIWHHPEPDWLPQALATVIAALANTGFDPLVGRKLFHLMRIHQFADISVAVASYHLIAGKATVRQDREWDHKLQNAMPAITAAVGDYDQAVDLVQRFLAYLNHPDTLTYSVQFTVLGTKHNL